MRTFRFAVVAAIAMIASAPQARAALLVYEGFNYTTGTASGSGVELAGQNGGIGMTGTWSTFTNNAYQGSVYQEGNLSGVNFNVSSSPVANQFDGTVANLPHTGGYYGATTTPTATPTVVTNDHHAIWRSLDPSVTATFTDGSTTWFSFVSARSVAPNTVAARFAIGAGEVKDNRGHLAAGQAIGVGGGLNANGTRIHAQVWEDVDGTTTNVFNVNNVTGAQISTGSGSTVNIPTTDYFYWEVGTASPGTSTLDSGSAIPNIIIGKIVWSDTGNDVISFARFLESDGPLTEAMFDAIDISSAGWTTQFNLDQSQFDTLSVAGGRFFADELRIATTFDEVIGLTAVTAVPAPAALPAGLALLALAAARRRRA